MNRLYKIIHTHPPDAGVLAVCRSVRRAMPVHGRRDPFHRDARRCIWSQVIRFHRGRSVGASAA